jgi:hypothetical protein
LHLIQNINAVYMVLYGTMYAVVGRTSTAEEVNQDNCRSGETNARTVYGTDIALALKGSQSNVSAWK